ncbi:MAG: hypothetical protein HC866_27135, partial [Leptolyngbyaceae cyanobacterium RU_5_1]|nr:hypothetical protein [Leptolyngbyaceae cyanobacterium RU_5_1]
ITPHPNGFILSTGNIRKLIYIPDESETAAHYLAQFFNGTVYTVEVQHAAESHTPER